MRCLLRILEHGKSLLYVRLLPLTHRSVGYPVLCTVVSVVLTPVLLLIRPASQALHNSLAIRPLERKVLDVVVSEYDVLISLVWDTAGEFRWLSAA